MLTKFLSLVIFFLTLVIGLMLLNEVVEDYKQSEFLEKLKEDNRIWSEMTKDWFQD